MMYKIRSKLRYFFNVYLWIAFRALRLVRHPDLKSKHRTKEAYVIVDTYRNKKINIEARSPILGLAEYLKTKPINLTRLWDIEWCDIAEHPSISDENENGYWSVGSIFNGVDEFSFICRWVERIGDEWEFSKADIWFELSCEKVSSRRQKVGL